MRELPPLELVVEDDPLELVVEDDPLDFVVDELLLEDGDDTTLLLVVLTRWLADNRPRKPKLTTDETIIPFFNELTSANALCFGMFGFFFACFAGAIRGDALTGAEGVGGVYAGYTYSCCLFAASCRLEGSTCCDPAE